MYPLLFRQVLSRLDPEFAHHAAMAVIRSEIERGWILERYITETLSGRPDPMVEPLRDRADFQQLMRGVRERNATAFARLEASGRPLVPDLPPDEPGLAAKPAAPTPATR